VISDPSLHFGFLLWLLAVSFGTSALGGMLGMASGIFIVPILTTWGGIDIRAAVPASLVSVIACSCGSAASYLDLGLTNVRLAILLETATTTGAVTGFLLMGIVPAPFLFLLFALILIVSARQMFTRRGDEHPVPAALADSQPSGGPARSPWMPLRLDSSYPDPDHGVARSYRVHRVGWGMALMYGAGVISALLGIGSGVLKIPAMDTALRLPMKVSSATSNFMIGVTAAASAGAYFLRGQIDPLIAGPVALGSVVGAIVGARLLMRIPSDRLRVGFVIVLVVLAVQMALAAFDLRLPGA
jgi:uncharacterized membrane protein YfcA